MIDSNGHPEQKLRLLVDWPEERAIEIPVQLRPSADPLPVISPPLRPRPDTTPPFRHAS